MEQSFQPRKSYSLCLFSSVSDDRLRRYTTSDAMGDALAADDFDELYPEWKQYMLERTNKYGRRLFYGEVDENAAVPPVKASEVIIEYDGNNYPVLPYLDDGREITMNTVRQKNLHAYLTAHWREWC